MEGSLNRHITTWDNSPHYFFNLNPAVLLAFCFLHWLQSSELPPGSGGTAGQAVIGKPVVQFPLVSHVKVSLGKTFNPKPLLMTLCHRWMSNECEYIIFFDRKVCPVQQLQQSDHESDVNLVKQNWNWAQSSLWRNIRWTNTNGSKPTLPSHVHLLPFMFWGGLSLSLGRWCGLELL